MRGLLAVLALGVTVANPAAQTTAKVPSQRPPVAAPKSTSVRISVKDQDGASLAGVRLLLSGSGGEFTTGAAGTAIVPIPKPGTFRIRCEHEGFVTLEREFTVGAGASIEREDHARRGGHFGRPPDSRRRARRSSWCPTPTATARTC
jgi:hypothetical protein